MEKGKHQLKKFINTQLMKALRNMKINKQMKIHLEIEQELKNKET